MSTSDPIPADGPWMLARVLRGLSIDGFDPDELPQPYPRLIAAALAAGRPNALAAADAELHTLPEVMQRSIAAALNALDPRQPRSAPPVRSRTAADLLKADLPPLRWLVEGLLVRPGLTLLGGQPKVGKAACQNKLTQFCVSDLLLACETQRSLSAWK